MSSINQPALLAPWSGDLYAPTWAGVTPQLPGYCDVDFDYPMGPQGEVFWTVSLAPGQISLKNPIQIDSDADYLAREIYVTPVGGTQGDPSTGIANPQDLKIRITDGDGNAITSDWCTANDLCGPVGPVPLPFRKGSIVFVDLWNQGTGTLVVQMGFKGFKRFACSDKQGPLPPFYPAAARYCREWPGVIFEEYEYFYEFSNGGSLLYPPWVRNLQPISPTGVFAQLVLQTDNDADFLWRGTTGMIMQAGGPVAQVQQELFLTFYDNSVVPLAKAVPRPGFIPASAGPGAELVLSNGGGRMSPHFPEIFIPRGGTIPVDILLQVPSAPPLNSVQFSLRGFKVYSEADCQL